MQLILILLYLFFYFALITHVKHVLKSAVRVTEKPQDQ